MQQPKKTDTESRPTGIPNSDGAVRELEKAAITAQKTSEAEHGPSGARQEPAVISLGKAGGGAPEEEANASKISPTAQEHIMPPEGDCG